jgi:oligopeptide transport system permease protein
VLRYILRRLLWMPLVMLVLVTVSFFMMRLAPGHPFSAERRVPPEILASMEAKYGLDRPMGEQYLRYLGRVVQGDLGPSYKWKDRTVNEIVAAHVGPSVVLGVTALVLALAVGLAAGVVGAFRQNSVFDHSAMAVAMFGMSVPPFVTGPVLVLLFALVWHVFPVAGYSADVAWWPLAATAALYVAWRVTELTRRRELDRGREAGAFWLFVLAAGTCLAVVLLVKNPTLRLPALVLALPFASRIARLMRGGMLEVVNQDYVRTARAKGLSETTVVVRHALKGGVMPVVSYLGPAVAGLLTGSLVVERIFNIPGIGREFVESALNRDYMLVLGTVILYGALLLVMNLLVDVAYGFLDPRIRYD